MSAAPTKWGIASAGKISNDFTIALEFLPPTEHQVIAIAARDLNRAKEFAKKHKIPKAYGSYEELATDKEIDVVYIGSIHPQHLPLSKLFLENGKNVLCEKPLSMNVNDTKLIIDIAKKKNLFLMEALWARFNPIYTRLREELDSGRIGDIVQVIASFGEPIADVERIMSKELGGSVSLDIGVYCVHLINVVFGRQKPIRIKALAKLGKQNVDETVNAILEFEGGKMASVTMSCHASFPNEGFIVGKKGTIKLNKPFWCGNKLEIEGVGLIEYPYPSGADQRFVFQQSATLRFEAIEVRNCLLRGDKESKIHPHADTIWIAETLEAIRKEVGSA